MKKIGIVYGHVASNMGDLALNTGIAALLAKVAPEVTVHAVFLDPNKTYTHNAIDSFSAAKNLTYATLEMAQGSRKQSTAEKEADALRQCLEYLNGQRDFLDDTSLNDCDAILYNSGEHLFSHPDNENTADLLFRMLPFVAAHRAGIPLTILPSTFGPFTPGIALDIVNLLTGNAASIAARDARSFKVLQALYPQQDNMSLHLDPAFFIPATRKKAPGKLRHIGIAMRQENFGLRLGKILSAQHSSARKEDAFKSTLAYQYSYLLATKFLTDKQNKVTFFIQTLADRNLALQLEEDLKAAGFGAQIDVQYPQTVAEHQAALASVDAVIASRFHACILSLAQAVPAVGIHFEQHGHKMQGLFEMLEIPEHCLTLAPHNLDEAAEKALSLLAAPASVNAAYLPALDRRMLETQQWLHAALQQQARPMPSAEAHDAAQQIGFAAYTIGIEKIILRQRLDSDHLKTSLTEAQRTLHKQFTAHRIGRAILDAKKSWQGLRRLPHILLDIRHSAREKRRNKRPKRPEVQNGLRQQLAHIGRLFQEGGINAALLFGIGNDPFIKAYDHGGINALHTAITAQQSHGSAKFKAFCFKHGSEITLQQNENTDALTYARTANSMYQTPASLTLLIDAAIRNLEFDEAVKAAESLAHCTAENKNFTEDQAIERAYAFRDILAEATRIQPTKPVLHRVADRSVYFLHGSLPYVSGGYATRAHGIASAIQKGGFDIRPVTRPNFPFDATEFSKDSDTLPRVAALDNIPYQRTDGEISRTGANEILYMRDCIDRFEAVLRAERPAVVHGRSTYLIALPALIAARRCGIPFVYEISGLWEIVHESRAGAKNKKADTGMIRLLEKVTAENADHVFTLTEAMRQEMISRGVAPDKITLTPNCVAPDKFAPLPRDDSRAADLNIPQGVPVIGYIGSFVDYEGLEDLIEACNTIANKGIDFRLLLIGDGASLDGLRGVVKNSSIQDKVIFTGRVPHADVNSYYSLIDICPFPRKAWPVCEMVSPMKPLEAMAMGKTILVSSVAALAEMVTDNVTGCIFEKSNTADLAHKLEDLLKNEALRKTIGIAAREWVAQNRDWNTVSSHIIEKYKHAITTDILSKAA